MQSADAIAAAVASLAMVLIVGARYILTSGSCAWLSERLRPGFHAGRGPQIRREIGWSFISAIIYGLPSGVLAWGWQARGWTRLYSRPTDFPLWWLPLSLLVCLMAHDSWFYWTHRLMHRPALFRRMHAVHHFSRAPTAWAAMSFHPWEALTGAFVVPALVCLLPLYTGVVLVLLMIMTIMGVTNHMGWEVYPRWLVHGWAGKWLITATHHQLHHDKYRFNYGLYFRFWDRVCGTDDGLGSFELGSSERGRFIR